MHRIGIVALLHESNTFIDTPTTIEHFRMDVSITGKQIFEKFGDSHHEIGGFLHGLGWPGGDTSLPGAAQVEIVPIAAYRATPSGTITSEAWEGLVCELLEEVRQSMLFDGLLIAAHGAAVSQGARDADGNWLGRLRGLVGQDIPMVATLDAHANLSPAMVQACDALISYRTNPHLDQHARGVEAARMLLGILNKRWRPKMVAEYLPMIINIERQSTDEPHLKAIYDLADQQLSDPRLLSNSILLGFPYADVNEMGSAVIAISDGDEAVAKKSAKELATALWNAREAMEGVLIDIKEAISVVSSDPDHRYCLLDMGDNVGGGSAADGTSLAIALSKSELGPSFVCIYDPAVVKECQASSVGSILSVSLGGKTDSQHGPNWECEVRVVGFYDGKFREDRPRHGGITEFDQGATVVLELVNCPMTIMVSSKRMVPFSLHQLTSCGLDPSSFRVLVAKGVHAPLAAYREICDRFLRVNTLGSTCADIHQLHYEHRRVPLFPLERDFSSHQS